MSSDVCMFDIIVFCRIYCYHFCSHHGGIEVLSAVYNAVNTCKYCTVPDDGATKSD